MSFTLPSTRITFAGISSRPRFYSAAYIRHEYIIALFIRELNTSVQRKGQHAPIDAVAAVALCGVFVADIRIAPQYPLAGCGLFARGTIARLVRKQYGPECRIGKLALRADLLERVNQLLRRFARATVGFHGPAPACTTLHNPGSGVKA